MLVVVEHYQKRPNSAISWYLQTVFKFRTVGHTRAHKVEPTEMCIDYDKLRQQEKIFFYDDILLFEDELADNGSAVLRVKIVRLGPAYLS